MCMADDCDDYVTVLSKDLPVARKSQKCGECYRKIEPGELYQRENAIFGGEFVSYITCKQCVVVRAWLSRQCGGFVYGGIGEDVEGHLQDYMLPLPVRFGIARLVVGMRARWKYKKMPRLPLTSFDLAAQVQP